MCRWSPDVRHWPRWLLAVVMVAGALVPVLPAHAITHAVPTGENYAAVGAAWLLITCCDDNDHNEAIEIPPYRPDNAVGTSGILIAPNVFLTTGSSFRNGRHVAVTFKNPLGAPPNPPPAPYDPFNPPPSDFTDPSTVYSGYVYYLPGFDFEDAHTRAGYDLAVVILDRAVTGVPLGTLAPIGSLKTGAKSFTAVTYGSPTKDPDTKDFQRRTSTWKLEKSSETTARLSGSQRHKVCDGDLGGPLFNQSGAATALIFKNSAFCKYGVTAAYRLDTARVYNFLCAVGNGQLNEVSIDNDLDPATGAQPVHYAAVVNPSVLTSAYCGAGGTTSQTDAATPHADHQQREHRHHEHGGGHHRAHGQRR